MPVIWALARAITKPYSDESAESALALSRFFPLRNRYQRNRTYRALSPGKLVALLKELPKRPLLAGEKGVQLSLAGAQDKIPVRIEGDEISLPLGGAPSTHILKPSVDRFAGVVFNEALVMNLATAIELSAAKERYDRIQRPTAKGIHLERLHQEDFCQALNIPPETKYQREGGPSVKRCFALVRDASRAPVLDLSHLLDGLIFNYLVGNNDAHGKNFSLLYHGIGTANLETPLAPLYDIVSTTYYPELSEEMAMKLGREYRPNASRPLVSTNWQKNPAPQNRLSGNGSSNWRIRHLKKSQNRSLIRKQKEFLGSSANAAKGRPLPSVNNCGNKMGI